jgi:hypothetical protein
MKTKVIPIESHDKFIGRTPLAKCRKMIKADEQGFSDEQVLEIRDFIHCLAKMYYDYYMRCKKGQHKSRIIDFKTGNNNEDKSNSLCKGEYGRTG